MDNQKTFHQGSLALSAPVFAITKNSLRDVIKFSGDQGKGRGGSPVASKLMTHCVVDEKHIVKGGDTATRLVQQQQEYLGGLK